jgi:hypothetical protein
MIPSLLSGRIIRARMHRCFRKWAACPGIKEKLSVEVQKEISHN